MCWRRLFNSVSMSCRRYFVDMRSLKEHFKTKMHKKRYGTIHSTPWLGGRGVVLTWRLFFLLFLEGIWTPASPFAPRLKQLREEPYTQAEAERAAGMGSYIPPKAVHVTTQPVEEHMDWRKAAHFKAWTEYIHNRSVQKNSHFSYLYCRNSRRIVGLCDKNGCISAICDGGI